MTAESTPKLDRSGLGVDRPPPDLGHTDLGEADERRGAGRWLLVLWFTVGVLAGLFLVGLAVAIRIAGPGIRGAGGVVGGEAWFVLFITVPVAALVAVQAALGRTRSDAGFRTFTVLTTVCLAVHVFLVAGLGVFVAYWSLSSTSLVGAAQTPSRWGLVAMVGVVLWVVLSAAAWRWAWRRSSAIHSAVASAGQRGTLRPPFPGRTVAMLGGIATVVVIAGIVGPALPDFAFT